MNGRERIEAALKLEIPDVVPTISASIDTLIPKATSKTVQEYYSNAETYAKANVSFWRRLGCDDILVWWPHVLPEALGAKLSYREIDYVSIKSPIIKTMDDVNNVHVPDPENDGKLPVVLEAMRILDDDVGDKVCITGFMYGPYTEAGNLMGFDQALISTIKKTDMLKKLSEKVLEAQIKFGEAMVAAGCRMIEIGEPMASPPILPVDTYEEIVLPPLTKLTRALKKAGAYTFWHPCARTKGEYPILQQLLHSEADMIGFSETVDMRTVKEMFAHKKCVAGNIDPVMMCRATTDKIEQEVKKIIDSAAAGGGFIFTAGCSIPTDTPLENVEAMVKAVHRYGRYP